MSSVSTTNISGTDPGTDHDFGRPSGTGVFLYRYPGTSYLATITLSLRDKIHSSAEALLKLTLMGAHPYRATRPNALTGCKSSMGFQPVSERSSMQTRYSRSVRYRSTSMAAAQPWPAAVTACRSNGSA